MVMTQEPQVARLPVNEEFARVAAAAAIGRAAEALLDHGFDVVVVDDADAAREAVLELVPEGAEVGQAASVTFERIGITEIIERSGRYDAVRPKTRAMDRATQGREIRRMSSTPDWFLTSVQAVTEDGRLLIASQSGSQLAPAAYGSGRVIVVAGAQKIVPTLEDAFRRVDEYNFPIEDARAQAAYGRHSAVNKILVVNADRSPGRTTVILVREPVGT
jgi:hypothetical protein